MRDRLTARVLLFDALGQLLLMKGRLPSTPEGPGIWFTVGGGAEPGETILQAAAREIVEETGFTDAVLGPVVWRRDGPLMLGGGETVMFREHYVVARCAGGDPDRRGWDAEERRLIDDIRWWPHDALLATDETVYPPGLTDHLVPILAGDYPAVPRVIAW